MKTTTTAKIDVQIEQRLLEDIQSAVHPSEFQTGDGYGVLILRLPEMGEEGLGVVSYAFVVKEGEGYRFDRQKGVLVPLGSLGDLHAFLDEKTDELLKQIQRYYTAVDQLEETLYEAVTPGDFMARWLAYKKDVSLIHRLMFHAGLAFDLFVRRYRKEKGFDTLDYADLAEHMGRIRDLAKAAMEKLDNLYDFYRAKVDERMNRNMYWLTVISAIFLPLTLVTGFFGMNTGGLPYTDDPTGTWRVVWLSLALEALFLLPFLWLNLKKTKKFRIKRFSDT